MSVPAASRVTARPETTLAPYVAVPVLLAILTALRNRMHLHALEYVILPPIAVVIFTAFGQPESRAASLRSLVLLPTLGALTGVLCDRALGFTPWGVALATLIVLGLQRVTGAAMPPALALALLAMLLHGDPVAYVGGVLEATVIVAVAFTAWRRWSR